MLFLPQLVPRTAEEVFKEGTEEAQVAALEKELEAKNAAIREWQREAPIVGKAETSTDVRSGEDFGTDAGDEMDNDSEIGDEDL